MAWPGSGRTSLKRSPTPSMKFTPSRPGKWFVKRRVQSPRRISSPSSRAPPMGVETGRPLSSVPLRESMSRSHHRPPVLVSRAWERETEASRAMATGHWTGSRPSMTGSVTSKRRVAPPSNQDR